MLYSILCYNSEEVVFSWTEAENDAVMARLHAAQQKVAGKGQMGPSLRLQPVRTASTLRKTSDPPIIVDGPYAETKEALLGFYVVDMESREEVEDFVRELAKANPTGAYEIRPVLAYFPGTSLTANAAR